MEPFFYKAVLLMCIIATGCSRSENAVRDWQIRPFEKFESNPILTPSGSDWQSKDVFNPAAYSDGNVIYLLYRAEDSTGIGQWNGTSRIGLAKSSDGLHFNQYPEPVFEPKESWELPGGTEDPRLVKIKETFYLTYTAYDGEKAKLALASSPDLKNWTRHGLIFPELEWTKSGAIIPQKINGKYWMYFGDTNIWIAWSNDLIHWTRIKEPVMRTRPQKFDSKLIEPGPTPIVTKKGILMLYNGADNNLVYRSGQALFDRKHPGKLIARSDTHFLEPDLKLEKEGQIPNVVFIEGFARLENKLFLYYGMGDSGIGVAIHELKN